MSKPTTRTVIAKKRKPGPGCSIKLTDDETRFVAFIMGTYVGLLMKHKGKLNRTYKEARRVSLRVMKKINASVAEQASWERRMEALRAATMNYLSTQGKLP